MKRWHVYDLIRLALRANFRPEDYLAAASCSGRFVGLPASDGSLRSLGLRPGEDEDGAIIRRDVAYLVSWAERADVEVWTAGAMLIAALVPARLPWRTNPASVLVNKERWPDGYARLRHFDPEGKESITVGDVERYARRTTVAGSRLALELRNARLRKMSAPEGLSGTDLRAALVTYQGANGVPVSGVFDVETDRAIVRQT